MPAKKSFARKASGANRRLKPTISFRFEVAATPRTDSNCSSFMASGFSTNTCLSRSNALRASSACKSFFVPITTRFTLASSSTSSALETAYANPNRLPTSCAEIPVAVAIDRKSTPSVLKCGSNIDGT